jgi:nucleotide-binding universal stress UspA family protein
MRKEPAVFGICRVIVGASGSPGGLRVLRCAEELARGHHASLTPVLAWVPPGGDVADYRAPCPYLRRAWAEDARQRLTDALNAAWGGIPADLLVQPVVERGEAGRVLVTIARPDDLLVVGAGRRGALARLVCGRVSRYCLARAPCPVLAVPPPALAQEIGHGLAGRVFRHRPLTVAQILENQGKTAA